MLTIYNKDLQVGNSRNGGLLLSPKNLQNYSLSFAFIDQKIMLRERRGGGTVAVGKSIMFPEHLRVQCVFASAGDKM